MDRYMRKGRDEPRSSSDLFSGLRPPLMSSFQPTSSSASVVEDARPRDPLNSTSQPALVSPLSNGVADKWKRATQMLETHPSLMTHEILCMALKYRPPAHIVQCMLQLNPDAANLPKSGPSALQVAVQSYCSVGVVERLIRACPLALVETNTTATERGSFASLDPLAYAKRFRPRETELIRLLSMPLSHWMNEKKQISEYPTDALASSSADDSEDSTTTRSSLPMISSSSSSISSSSSSSSSTPPPVTRPSRPTVGSMAGVSATVRSLLQKRTTLGASPRPASVKWASPLTNLLSSSPKDSNAIDPQELANVKLICLAVLRGHRRLSAQVKALTETATQPKTSELDQFQKDMLDKVNQEMERQFKTQMIALDMKGQHMRSRARRMERRLLAKVSEKHKERDRHFFEHQVDSIANMARKRIQSVQRRLDELEKRIWEQPMHRPTASSCSPNAQARDDRPKQPRSTPIVFSRPFDSQDEVQSSLTEDEPFVPPPPVEPKKKPLLRQVLCKMGRDPSAT